MPDRYFQIAALKAFRGHAASPGWLVISSSNFSAPFVHTTGTKLRVSARVCLRDAAHWEHLPLSALLVSRTCTHRCQDAVQCVRTSHRGLVASMTNFYVEFVLTKFAGEETLQDFCAEPIRREVAIGIGSVRHICLMQTVADIILSLRGLRSTRTHVARSQANGHDYVGGGHTYRKLGCSALYRRQIPSRDFQPQF